MEETYGIGNENVEKPIVKAKHEEFSLSVSIHNPNIETLTLKRPKVFFLTQKKVRIMMV